MMRMFFKYFTLVLIIAFTSISVKAKDEIIGTSGGEFLKVGGAGSQFLKIGVGARAAGMAGAYTAVANDLTSIYWNPAGLVKMEKISGEFHYTQWFAGFSHNYSAVSMPISENFTVGAHMTSFSSGKIPETTISNPEGTGSHYSISDVSVGLTISGYLTDQFSFGVTGKYISNGFSSLTSTGFAFDIGTMYETGIQGINLGFSIFNLGTKMQYEGQGLRDVMKKYGSLKSAPWDVTFLSNAYLLPLIFRIGISSDIIDIGEHKLIGAFDFVTSSDIPEQFALGAEYTWNELLSLRGGYLLGQDVIGPSGGFGINYISGGFRGQIDYSITPTTNMGLINRISISVGLN